MLKEGCQIMEIIKLTIDQVENYKAQIMAMLKQSFEKSFPKDSLDTTTYINRIESLKAYISEEKALVYGSIISERLVGFIWFFGKEDNVTIHINHFVVDENYRRQGVGKALWNKVENYVDREGFEEIELFVTNSNKDAVNFYMKRNFEVERLVMKKRLLK